MTDILHPFTVANSLADVLEVFERHLFLSFNSHAVGVIDSFDATEQTATIRMAYKKVFYEPIGGVYKRQVVDYAPLVSCPVYFAGGGNSYQTFPVTKGDECLILFNDRDIDSWFSGSTQSEPNSSRMHSFTDALCIVGFRSRPNSIHNFDQTRSVWRKGNAVVALGDDLVKFENSTMSLKGLLQELVEEVKSLADAASSISVSGVTSGAGVSGVPVNAPQIVSIAARLKATSEKIGELLE